MRKLVAFGIASVLIALGLVRVCVARPQSSTTCLAYEPKEVTLTGTLVRKIFPGPPNYKSIRKGDRAEKYWILKLASPVCVDADKTGNVINRAQEDIRGIQVVFPDATGYKKYKDLISTKVIATGTLSGSISAHHHTNLLITVAEFAKAH